MKAYSPGSVTLFFEIIDAVNPLEKGSRGVGVCVMPGAVTTVEKSSVLKVYINSAESENTLQEKVAEKMGFTGVIRTELKLPVSQGFGMSAAASLSTALAIAPYTGATALEAAQIAHTVEIESKKGLGDVATQYEGGITVRMKNGIQPYGVVDRIYSPFSTAVLVILGEKIDTSEILSDPQKRKLIKRVGVRAMDDFLKDPTLERAIRIGRKFSERIGFVNDEMREIMSCCDTAAPCLLGNSLIIFGKCNENIYRDYPHYHVKIGSRADFIQFS